MGKEGEGSMSRSNHTEAQMIGGAEATGGGEESGGCGAGSGRIEAHDLCLEGKVRRDGCEPGAGSEAVAG